MISWLKRIFWPNVETRVVVLERAATKMRLQEWMADQTMTNNARKVLDNPTMQLMVSVLHTEHPAFVVIDPGTNLQDRAVHQARCEGYTLALANLEALARHQKMTYLPEPDFLPEEQPK